MARKEDQKSKNNASGRNRVQGFVFGINLEGTEDVVTEGIKAFTQAMAKSGLVVTSLPVTKPALLEAKPNSSAIHENDDEETEAMEEFAEVGDNSIVDDEVEEASSSRSSTRRNYNFRPPKFLDNLDLTKATQPINDFMSEKGNPTETNDRYIVVAVWLKEHLQIEDFNINHIYTVFDNLGWKAQIPVNHSQPLRDLKSKRHFLTKQKGEGYKVNWQGIQYVAKLGTRK